MSAKGATTTTTSSSPSSTTATSSSTSKSSAEEQNVEQVKIKNEPKEPIDLTETESYKTLIEQEINDILAEKLSQLILDNKLSLDELDDNALGTIKKINNDIEEGLNILNDFEQANDEKLQDGRVTYLCELIKKSEERVNGETSNASLTPNGESSSSNQSPAKSSTTQQYQNSNSQQSQLEELKKKCDEITQRTGK